MVKLVVRLLATAALRVRIRTSLKTTKFGDISTKVANTLLPAKTIKKDVPDPHSQRTGADFSGIQVGYSKIKLQARRPI